MKIRRFEPSDAAGVASLWQYWFRDKTRDPDADLVALATRLYAEHPNRNDEVAPLVAVEDDGSLIGFLGVTATPVIVDGRRGTMAGVFPSVVDPAAPMSVASLLMRSFLAGPQVLSFSDGGHAKFERIWETLGGRIAQLPSLRWVKVLRPTQMGLTGLLDGRSRSLADALAPVSAAADWTARGAAPARFTPKVRRVLAVDRRVREPLVAVPLAPADLVAASEAVHARFRLRPAYDEAYLAWLFARMRGIAGQGEFRATLLRDGAGRPAGWYVYYLARGRLSRVLALDATPRALDDVIDHLFADADAGGAGALVGRMGGPLRRPMMARGCWVDGRGSLLMMHARDASLLDDVELGRTGLSRLDGENWYWWAIDTRQVGGS
jgi:hypothetical protein